MSTLGKERNTSVGWEDTGEKAEKVQTRMQAWKRASETGSVNALSQLSRNHVGSAEAASSPSHAPQARALRL